MIDLTIYLDDLLAVSKFVLGWFVGGITSAGVVFLYLLRSDERKVAPR